MAVSYCRSFRFVLECLVALVNHLMIMFCVMESVLHMLHVE